MRCRTLGLLTACALALGCGKFQQARECGTFVKTVNAWLASPGAKIDVDAGPASDPKQVAADARRTAAHYVELSQSLGSLKVESEELAPRVKRYRELADGAAKTLTEVADALDRGQLDQARQKRVDFDTVAKGEGPLVQEINGLCR